MHRAFLRFLTETIQHETGLATYGSQGEPERDAIAVERRARIFDTQRIILARDGTQKVSRAVAIIEGPVSVSVDDRITLPDGTTPPILAVNNVKDLGGTSHHAEVYF